MNMNTSNQQTAIILQMQREAEIAYLRERIAALEARCAALAAENAGLKANLMFWDAEDPEAPYDTPGEIASAISLNYNEEFVVQVAAKMPNRTYRVCESWGQECKVELVESGEVKTPATDAYLAEVWAGAIDSLVDIKTKQLSYMHPDTHAFGATAMTIRSQINELQMFATQLRKGVQS